jgi:hypothetical protein
MKVKNNIISQKIIMKVLIPFESKDLWVGSGHVTQKNVLG